MQINPSRLTTRWACPLLSTRATTSGRRSIPIPRVFTGPLGTSIPSLTQVFDQPDEAGAGQSLGFGTGTTTSSAPQFPQLPVYLDPEETYEPKYNYEPEYTPQYAEQPISYAPEYRAPPVEYN